MVMSLAEFFEKPARGRAVRRCCISLDSWFRSRITLAPNTFDGLARHPAEASLDDGAFHPAQFVDLRSCASPCRRPSLIGRQERIREAHLDRHGSDM
jgi:hypothetical protein